MDRPVVPAPRVHGRPRVARAARIGAALLAATALLAAATRVRAHDFWLEPSTFHPTPGALVTLRLLVGENLAGEPVPRDETMLVRFVAAGSRGEIPVGGGDGADPAGIAVLAAPGRWVVAYESRPSAIELEAAKFEGYLAAEGLDRILALRRARGESGRPARELYSRCAKTLLVVGEADDPRADDASARPLGLTLELVRLDDAAGAASDEGASFRLLYEGRPIAGVLVSALHERSPRAPVAARTDEDGRVTLPLAAAGLWLVKAVHMVEAMPETGADYESFWASLTLEIGERQEASR